MATIVYADGVDPIQGSRRGLTFDKSQAGPYVKKRPSPINRQTNPRMHLRRNLKAVNEAYWALNMGQKALWTNFAQMSGIGGPWGMLKTQQGCAGYFACALNAITAGDGLPVAPGPPLPIAAPTVSALIRIDKDTVRATFFPAPAGAFLRIFLRQAIPGPGVRRWGKIDGYIAEYSALNPNSTIDLSTKFQHLAGWNGRYWVGFQNTTGGRSTEVLFEI